jgi:hypothetical protein
MVRNVCVWADTHSTGVIDELGRAVRHAEASISDETWSRLQQWVEDYDFIIPLGVEERERLRPSIDDLDARGLALMEQIAVEWPTDLTDGETLSFQYYSEGLMHTRMEAPPLGGSAGEGTASTS